MSSDLKLYRDWNYWEDAVEDDPLQLSSEDVWIHEPQSANAFMQPPWRIRLAIRVSKTSSFREPVPVELRQRFDRDRFMWQIKTETMSSLTDMVLLDEYQRIVGLGPAAIPLIIDALRSELDHWFPALRSIVGEDHAEGAETMQEAAERWIAWYDTSSSNDVSA